MVALFAGVFTPHLGILFKYYFAKILRSWDRNFRKNPKITSKKSQIEWENLYIGSEY